jgi:hypothetical protein
MVKVIIESNHIFVWNYIIEWIAAFATVAMTIIYFVFMRRQNKIIEHQLFLPIKIKHTETIKEHVIPSLLAIINDMPLFPPNPTIKELDGIYKIEIQKEIRYSKANLFIDYYKDYKNMDSLVENRSIYNTLYKDFIENHIVKNKKKDFDNNLSKLIFKNNEYYNEIVKIQREFKLLGEKIIERISKKVINNTMTGNNKSVIENIYCLLLSYFKIDTNNECNTFKGFKNVNQIFIETNNGNFNTDCSHKLMFQNESQLLNIAYGTNKEMENLKNLTAEVLLNDTLKFSSLNINKYKKEIENFKTFLIKILDYTDSFPIFKENCPYNIY